MLYLAKVYIQLKESILDPQGQAVLHALHNLNHDEVKDVRIGKYIELQLDAGSEAEARRLVEEHCQNLLANPVIESHRFDIEAQA
ncbi:MAG: phosphoribosylformylglycinamidine synthase subunit PurS [Leptospiraceae bacterium]|nr:phosphoribosylformylglycinamidine synthase subunit PurS [Leptospiraceae bacterium]